MDLATFNLADYTKNEAFDVQRELARCGYYQGRIDGIFDDASRQGLDDARKADAAGTFTPTARTGRSGRFI